MFIEEVVLGYFDRFYPAISPIFLSESCNSSASSGAFSKKCTHDVLEGIPIEMKPQFIGGCF